MPVLFPVLLTSAPEPLSIIPYPVCLGLYFYNWTYTGTGVTLAGTSTLPTVSLDFGLLATGGTLTVTPVIYAEAALHPVW